MSYKLLSSIYYSNNIKYEEIYKARLNSESTIKFNFNIGNNPAFVVINNEILNKIQKIYKKDKELFIFKTYIPGIALHQYANKCLIDEIKMTNEIEGVNSTRKEISDILVGNTSKKKRLYGLVKKYQLLLEEHIDLETCEDIRNIYDELVLQEVTQDDPDNAPDGEIFRKDGVSVLNESREPIHRGVNPEEEIIKMLDSGLAIINSDDINKLISISIFHYLFGYIHPFYDGNGRISRFISSYLVSQELEDLVSYRIAYTIKQNLKSYYKCFKVTNDKKNKGDLTGFVIFFLDIILKSLDELIKSLNDRREKLDFYHEKIEYLCEDEKTLTILFILVQDTLFGECGMDRETLYRISTVGLSKIKTSLDYFESIGIVEKEKESKKFIYSVNLDKIADIQIDKA
ncbi:MAG: Fic family protein [Clostridium sp.]